MKNTVEGNRLILTENREKDCKNQVDNFIGRFEPT